MSSIKIIRENTACKTGFFIRALDEYLVQNQKKWPRGNTIRPADIAECSRYLVCDILGFPSTNVIPPQYQRVFDNGNYVHKRYLFGYLNKLGMAAKVHEFVDGKECVKDFVEYSITAKEYWIKGKPDALIINKEEGTTWIFELKSVKQEIFNQLQQPEWAHVAQVHLYMFLTGLDRGLVLYENKNSQELKEFPIYRDEMIIEYLLNKIKYIQNTVLNYPTTKQLPPCECEHFNHCKNFIIPE